VDLERLDPAGWQALMSWFSGTSRPDSSTSEGRNSRSRSAAGGRARSRRCQESPGQLSLDLGFAMNSESL
jgi:hypothetical protein